MTAGFNPPPKVPVTSFATPQGQSFRWVTLKHQTSLARKFFPKEFFIRFIIVLFFVAVAWGGVLSTGTSSSWFAHRSSNQVITMPGYNFAGNQLSRSNAFACDIDNSVNLGCLGIGPADKDPLLPPNRQID